MNKTTKRDWLRSPLALLLLLAIGCAGTMRDCSSSCASTLGSDWLLVQYQYDSKPMNCWQLKDTALASEGSNGLFWKDSQTGNLVHVSGIALNRVQISGGNWQAAADHLGVDLTACGSGRYGGAR